jgi:hypothetical protein
MPRAYSAALIAEKKKRAGVTPVMLLDLLLRNGTYKYWSDFAGSYPMKLGAGGDVAYSPWIKSAGPFRFSRSLRADAGDIVVQNLSGNTLEREVALAIKASEFIGALAVFRSWYPLLAESEFEFHGYLTKPVVGPTEASFRLLPLLDTNVQNVPAESYIQQCSWRFKGALCGSTGTATHCPKDFPSCEDSSRAAVERFNGTPHLPSTISLAMPVTPPASGGGGGGGGDEPCWSPESQVRTRCGTEPIERVEAGSEVRTKGRAWRRVKRNLVHEYDGPLLRVPGAGRITPGHHLADGDKWRPAQELYFEASHYRGLVHNLVVDAEDFDERSYEMANGVIAHNSLKAPP